MRRLNFNLPRQWIAREPCKKVHCLCGADGRLVRRGRREESRQRRWEGERESLTRERVTKISGEETREVGETKTAEERVKREKEKERDGGGREETREEGRVNDRGGRRTRRDGRQGKERKARGGENSVRRDGARRRIEFLWRERAVCRPAGR